MKVVDAVGAGGKMNRNPDRAAEDPFDTPGEALGSTKGSGQGELPSTTGSFPSHAPMPPYDYLPFPVWVEDLSAVKQRLDSLLASGSSSIQNIFSEQPEIRSELLALVKLREINAAARVFFEAASLEELTPQLLYFGDEASAISLFEELLVTFADGADRFECEAGVHTISGQFKVITLRALVAPEARDTWGRVINSFLDITHLKEVESNLRQAHRELDGIFGALPDLYFRLRADGTILDYRTGRLRKLYVPPEVFLYKQVQSVLPPAIGQSIATALATCLCEQEPVALEYTLSFPNGPQDYEARLVPLTHDEAVAVIRDITDAKRAETALRTSEERYRTIVENITDALYIHDLSGKILDVNETACRMLGYTRDELVGANLSRLYGHADVHRQQAHLQELSFKDAILFEERHARKDGTYVPVEVSAKVVSRKTPGLIQKFVRDITERRQAEEARHDLETQLQQTQKLESLGILAGGIAHDFNNMLTAILGNADLALLDTPAPSPTRPMLEQIERTARRAAELCKQMLAYSGRGHFVLKPINLSDMVKQAKHAIEASVSAHATLRYELAPDLPSVDADPTQLRQVILNLVVNASEAIEPQTGMIDVHTGLVNCTRDYLDSSPLKEQLPEGRYAFVEVSDTGCGMNPETQKRMFDPFYSTKFTGRGLGLAAVTGIVRGHKGTIKVASEPGKGTTVRVLFPISPVAKTPTAPSSPPLGEWRGAGTILLVDDDDTIRLIAKRILERLGFDVLLAADGQEALDVYCATPASIVCVLLDLTMPRMDGEETFRALRQINPDLPILVSSGYSKQDVVALFVGEGLTGFIQKPYRSDELSSILRTVLP